MVLIVSLDYIKIDQVIRLVSKLCMGACMATFDVEAACHNMPVHPPHCILLGMKWHDQFYVDMVLSFGLQSAPFIFNSIADMVEWILANPRFLTSSITRTTSLLQVPFSPPQCAQNLATAIEVCQRLGLPLHPGKCVGPTMVLVVFGIKLDSMSQLACLLQEKLLALKI